MTSRTLSRLRLRTSCRMRSSSVSMTPARPERSNSAANSSRLNCGGASAGAVRRLSGPTTSLSSAIRNGAITRCSAINGGATSNANAAPRELAMSFGITSPNRTISINDVITSNISPIAPTSAFMTRIELTTKYSTFTVMLLIRMVISSIRGCASKDSTARPARPVSRRTCMRCVSLRPNSAVSAPEKNPLSRSKTGSVPNSP